MKKSVLLPVIVFVTIICAVLVWKIVVHLNAEVIESFGVMNDKLDTTNKASDSLFFMRKSLTQHKKEAVQYQAKEIEKYSDKLYNYIDSLKDKMLTEVNMDKDNINFKAMDKPSQLLFKNNRVVGKELITNINTYRTKMAEHCQGILNESFNYLLQNSFKTENIGKSDWLIYQFEGFPLIANYTKLSAFQNDIRKVELMAYTELLSKK